MDNTSREFSNGTASVDAVIVVKRFDDGTYAIGASSQDTVMPISGQTSGELEVLRPSNGGCYVTTKADSSEHAALERPAVA